MVVERSRFADVVGILRQMVCKGELKSKSCLKLEEELVETRWGADEEIGEKIFVSVPSKGIGVFDPQGAIWFDWFFGVFFIGSLFWCQESIIQNITKQWNHVSFWWDNRIIIEKQFIYKRILYFNKHFIIGIVLRWILITSLIIPKQKNVSTCSPDKAIKIKTLVFDHIFVWLPILF